MPTVAELKAEAKAKGIKGISKMKKEDLCKALNKGDECFKPKKKVKVATYNLQELRQMAKSRGLKGYSTMKKADLCKLLNINNCEKPYTGVPPSPKPKAQKKKAPPKKSYDHASIVAEAAARAALNTLIKNYGIHNQKEYKKWMLKNHPDKLHNISQHEKEKIIKVVQEITALHTKINSCPHILHVFKA